jgi:hypothetical protein
MFNLKLRYRQESFIHSPTRGCLQPWGYSTKSRKPTRSLAFDQRFERLPKKRRLLVNIGQLLSRGEQFIVE